MYHGGRKPELHRVDGELMTAEEIADLLGITYNALQCRRSRLGGASYQLIVDMYRANQLGTTHDRAGRYLIEGRWMTRCQIAGELGVQAHSISE